MNYHARLPRVLSPSPTELHSLDNRRFYCGTKRLKPIYSIIVTNSDSFHQLVKLGFHTNAWGIQEYLKFMQMNDSNDAPPDVGSILCFGHPMVLNFTAAL